MIPDDANLFEGEEVLQEIDVYFSNNLNNLLLLQYPLKPAWRPYDPGLCQEVRLKPQSEILEFDYSIPTDELASATKKEMLEGDEEQEFHTVRSQRMPLQTNYAIGVHKGSDLYLTALPKVYQVRPDFNHINVQIEEKKKRMAEKERQEARAKGELDDEDDVVLTSIPIRVTQESERAKYLREHSWEHMKKQEDMEKWTVLKLYDKEDERSEQVFSQLSAASEEVIPCDYSAEQYINLLAAPIITVPIDTTFAPEVSWTQIRAMPLEEKLLNIMLKVQILSHREIYELLEIPLSGSNLPLSASGNLLSNTGPPVPPITSNVPLTAGKAILDSLNKFANIVRGVWIIKSSLLKMPLKKMNCRNYILSRFALSDGPLTSKSLAEELAVTPPYIKSILTQFCYLKLDVRAWEFKKPPDVDFIRTHPKLVDGYAKIWRENTEKLRLDALALADSPEDSGSTQQSSLGLLSGVSADEKELILFLNGLFAQYGVLSLPVIKNKLIRAFKANEFKSLSEKHLTSQAYLEEVLKKIAGFLHGGYFLKTASSNAETERYRQILIEMFTEKLFIVKKDVNAYVKRITGKNIPETSYIKILREFAFFKNNQWIFKSGNLNDADQAELIKDEAGSASSSSSTMHQQQQQQPSPRLGSLSTPHSSSSSSSSTTTGLRPGGLASQILSGGTPMTSNRTSAKREPGAASQQRHVINLDADVEVMDIDAKK